MGKFCSIMAHTHPASSDSGCQLLAFIADHYHWRRKIAYVSAYHHPPSQPATELSSRGEWNERLSSIGDCTLDKHLVEHLQTRYLYSSRDSGGVSPEILFICDNERACNLNTGHTVSFSQPLSTTFTSYAEVDNHYIKVKLQAHVR